MNRLYTPDELVAILEAAARRGHRLCSVPFWDSAMYILTELGAGQRPVDVWLIDSTLYALLEGAKLWRDHLDHPEWP